MAQGQGKGFVDGKGGGVKVRYQISLLFACLLWLDTAAWARTGENDSSLPPLEHPQINTLVDALRVDQEVALVTGQYWDAAIEAFVAANPNKPAEARAFATAARDRERAVYKPLVVFSLDRNLPIGLYPDLAAQRRALSDCSGQSCYSEQNARAQKYHQLQAEGERRFRADLPDLIKRASSPDAISLRDLNRKGVWNCFDSERRRLSKESENRHREACAPLLADRILLKLQRTKAGQQLIRLETTTYIELGGMIAMAHDAGISLYRLLPPDEVRKAGLQVPPTDLSSEQLIGARSQGSDGSSQ